MKVLIGIDESPHAQTVLRWVMRTPWPPDTRFLVLSAAPIRMAAYSMIEVGAMRAVETLEQETVQTHQELVSAAERELRTAGLPTEGIVEPGDPRDVLIRTAEGKGVDMIVVGSHGRTGLARLLVGSVASYVASHAPCTVVIVRQPPALG